MSQRIAPDTDILALLPVQERDPVLQQAFTQMVDTGQQRLIVLVGADDWAQARDAADATLAVVASRRSAATGAARTLIHSKSGSDFPTTSAGLADAASKNRHYVKSRPSFG